MIIRYNLANQKIFTQHKNLTTYHKIKTYMNQCITNTTLNSKLKTLILKPNKNWKKNKKKYVSKS